MLDGYIATVMMKLPWKRIKYMSGIWDKPEACKSENEICVNNMKNY